MSSFYPGKRLSTKGERCTVRYVGEVKGKQGQWLGVEWDDPTRGKHSGTHDGIEYFKCRSSHPTAGSFLRPSATWDQPRTFLEALRTKYAPIETGEHASNQNVIRISGKEAEEVGFEKIARQQAQLQNLRIVVLDDLLVKAYDESTTNLEDSLDYILETCSNITDLDVGRNLFETLAEISEICDRLPKLKFLRLDANRLRDFSGRENSSTESISGLAQLTSASLDHMLCKGKELEILLRSMPDVRELSASSNQLGSLDECSLPSTLNSITLEDNNFSSLEDVRHLGECCPQLRTLNLKNNQISTTFKDSQNTFELPETITDLDIAYNNITSWSIINDLPITFPGLKHLRIAHNPLFSSLRSADGKPLTSADGYMLTIARLPQLETLNYSKITEKERLNSETYYLSQIGRELSLSSKEQEKDILSSHPRWTQLCEEYGEPKVERQAESKIDPNSLAARLLECTVYSPAAAAIPNLPDEHNPLVVEIPKSCSIYKVHGVIGRRLGVEPTQLRLILETGEKDRVDMATWNGVEEWDSDEEDAEEAGEEWKEREEELVPGTRPLGTFVDGMKARIRVELRPSRE
ncbi:tubulin-specific chaperone, partial [Aureobasidium melanogenum]